METAGGDRQRTADAEAAFASFLARVRAGEAVDFDVFCGERPTLAPVLRDLHAAWKAGSGSRPPSRLSLREFLDRRPEVALDPETPEGETGSGVRERLGSLGARSGRYQLREEVARGGMGVILKVWDCDLRRTLAMKAAYASVEDEASPVSAEQVTRFLEEAQITGQLDHPGIVPVHELGVDDEGRIFFTMRLVRGRTLDEIFRLSRADEDGWGRARALNVMVRVCEAMAYAHSKGVIHRDIKPANVMVGAYGEVYVMDWGLAKVIGRPDAHGARLNASMSILRTQVRTDRAEDISRSGDSSHLTMEGTIMGTPAFMPPEQAEGRIDALDPRSDVYSVGALLYTLLAGHTPYLDSGPATAVDVIGRLLAGPPRSVAEIDPNVPPELVAICEKAMARRPEHRYPDMIEMADDLRAYVERRVVRAYRTGALAEFRKWVVRNRGTAAALAALLLLAVGGSAFVAWQQRAKAREIATAQTLTEQARARAEDLAQKAVSSADAARVNAARAERQSYLANLAATHASLRTFETREAKHLLAQCAERFRGWEWRHLRLSTDTSLRVLAGHGGRVTAVAASADGTRVASGGEDRTVRLWDAATGRPLFDLPGAPDVVTALAFSGDGRLAAASKDMLVRIWDVEAGRLLGTMTHDALVRALAFDASGDRLVAGNDEGAHLWDARAFRYLFGLGHDDAVQAVAFVADGGLATATGEGVHLWDLASPEQRALVPLDEGATALAWSGRQLAVATHETSVVLVDPGEARVVGRLRGHEDPVSALAFTPSGARLATASYDKTVRIWDAEDRTPLAVLQGHDEAVLAIACGGDRVVSGSADASVRLWATEGGGPRLTLRGDEDFLSAVVFSPDGTRVAASSAGHGEIRIWDARTGRAVAYVEEAGGLSSLAFSPDGTRILSGGEEDAVGRIHDAGTGRLLHRLEGHTASVTAVAFAPDGTRVATGSMDNAVRLWDASTGAPGAVLEGHDRVGSVAFSPDGARLAVAFHDGAVVVHALDDGSDPVRFAAHEGAALVVRFTPDGARLATGGSDGHIRFWHASTGAPAAELTGHGGPVRALCFDAAGTRLFSGSHDKTVRVWDASTGDQLLRLVAHDGWVTGVALSPDGTRLASCSYDTTARIWRTER